MEKTLHALQDDDMRKPTCVIGASIAIEWIFASELVRLCGISPKQHCQPYEQLHL